MKMYLFLIAVLVFGTYSLSAQEDPNVMWTYQASFHSYPSVHPNGNILIRSHYDVLEINGLTGELIRKIYVPNPGQSGDMIEIAQDGSRFLLRGCLVDYESGEVMRTDLQKLHITFLHPSNSKVIFNYENMSLRILNLNDNTIVDNNVLTQTRSVTAMKVSNDGRFIAIAQRDFEDVYHTHFYLYDAQTMQLIRELENVVAEGRTIEFIQFSENAKFVGYGQLTGGTPKATFFSCESPYKKWEVKTDISNPYGMHSIGFIDDGFVFATSSQGVKSHSVIWDISNEKEIFRTDKYFSHYPLYNKTYNSLVVRGIILSTLDFNKILNSVSVDEPNEPIQKFITEYRNGILMISGIESNSPIINITISDTLGNIMFNNQIQSMNGRIELAVPLPSGVYIFQIREGNNNYSQKFIVTR